MLFQHADVSCLKNCLADAFLKRCYRYGFASESEHDDVLFDRVCVDLFHKIRCSEHCLHDILPPVISQYYMRQRAHSYVRPQCNNNNNNNNNNNDIYTAHFSKHLKCASNVTVIYIRNLLLINYCLFKDVEPLLCYSY